MIRTALRRKTIRPDREKIRQAVLDAAEAAGKQFGEQGLVSYLQAQAIVAPAAFMGLLGKIFADQTDVSEAPITRIEIVTPQGNLTQQLRQEQQPD